MRRSLLALAVVCATAGPALAQTEFSITLNPTGQLLAKGGGAKISATVTCTAGATGGASAFCSQRSGRSTAQGSGPSTDITCSGSPQTVDLSIFPSGGAAFKKGQAACFAEGDVCGPDGCDGDETTGTVNLRR
jgi:hypothetical protein